MSSIIKTTILLLLCIVFATSKLTVGKKTQTQKQTRCTSNANCKVGCKCLSGWYTNPFVPSGGASLTTICQKEITKVSVKGGVTTTSTSLKDC